MFTDMASFNISIKKCIMRFFGVLNGIDWRNKERNMKSLRESFNKRLKIKCNKLLEYSIHNFNQ